LEKFTGGLKLTYSALNSCHHMQSCGSCGITRFRTQTGRCFLD